MPSRFFTPQSTLPILNEIRGMIREFATEHSLLIKRMTENMQHLAFTNLTQNPSIQLPDQKAPPRFIAYYHANFPESFRQDLVELHKVMRYQPEFFQHRPPVILDEQQRDMLCSAKDRSIRQLQLWCEGWHLLLSSERRHLIVTMIGYFKRCIAYEKMDPSHQAAELFNLSRLWDLTDEIAFPRAMSALGIAYNQDPQGTFLPTNPEHALFAAQELLEKFHKRAPWLRDVENTATTGADIPVDIQEYIAMKQYIQALLAQQIPDYLRILDEIIQQYNQMDKAEQNFAYSLEHRIHSLMQDTLSVQNLNEALSSPEDQDNLNERLSILKQLHSCVTLIQSSFTYDYRNMLPLNRPKTIWEMYLALHTVNHETPQVRLFRTIQGLQLKLDHKRGLSVHYLKRDERTKCALTQLVTVNGGRGFSRRNPQDYIDNILKRINESLSPDKEKAIDSLKKKNGPYKALLTDPQIPAVFNMNGVTFFAHICFSILQRSPEAQKMAIESLMTTLCDGHGYCGPGKVQRIMIAVIQGYEPAVQMIDEMDKTRLTVDILEQWFYSDERHKGQKGDFHLYDRSLAYLMDAARTFIKNIVQLRKENPITQDEEQAIEGFFERIKEFAEADDRSEMTVDLAP